MYQLPVRQLIIISRNKTGTVEFKKKSRISRVELRHQVSSVFCTMIEHIIF